MKLKHSSLMADLAATFFSLGVLTWCIAFWVWAVVSIWSMVS